MKTYINRAIRQIFLNKLQPNKVLVLLGARRVGKTQFLLSERIKSQQYNEMLVNNYFWRTYQQQELDWIEEREGKLHAYEIKWNDRKKPKVPSAWIKAYPDSSYHVITPENYLDWIE